MPKPQRPKPKDYKRLDEIQAVYDKRQLDQALELALNFTRQRPKLIEGWDELFYIATEIGRLFIAWQANTHLMELDLHESRYVYNAISLATQLGLPFTTKYYIERYLKKFPDSYNVEKIQEIQVELDEKLQQLREDENIADSATARSLMFLELSNLYVSHGEFHEGRKISKQAQKLLKGVVAPANNISLSYAAEGDLEKALRTTEKILKEHPRNFHTRCNHAQFLARLGRAEDAQTILDELINESPENSDHWFKLIDTLAYAGQDAALVEVYERLVIYADGRGFKNFIEAQMHHLAAVSYARLDNGDRAEQLWQLALATDPNMEIAHQNLRDQRKPLGEKHGAWHFPVANWIPHSWIERLVRAGERASKKGEEAYRREIERTMKSVAGFEVVFEILLERGGSDALEFIFQISPVYPISGLKEFAQGQRGTDAARMKAANIAVEHGLIDPKQPVSLYSKGELTQVKLMNYEIYTESNETDLPDKAHEHYENAFFAVNDGEPEKALSEIETALAIVPDHRQLLNIKFTALDMLERTDEAEALVHYAAKIHPDYFFARINMARLLIGRGKLDEADEWVKPLLQQERFHISEYRALAIVHIENYIAREDVKSAVRWINMLADVDPDVIPEDYKMLANLYGTVEELNE